MMLSHFNGSPYKSTIKTPSQQRSKTPGKTSLSRTSNKRQSKSLIKGNQKNQTPFNALTLMAPIKQWNQGVRYYYLGKGNNHQGVRRALNLRKNLVQANNQEVVLLFKWTQNSFGFKYHRLGKDCFCFNHFQFHREITNKQRLVWNMLNFCESNKLNAYSYIPTTFIIDLTTGEEDMALHSFLKFYNRNIPQGFKGQKVNSILLPKIKHVPYMSAQQLRKKSQGNFYCKPICPKTFFGGANSYLWILKPTFMNRGRGVSLFSSVGQFQKLIWQYYQGEGLQDYENKHGIAQIYRVVENVEVQEPMTNTNTSIETMSQSTPKQTQTDSLPQTNPSAVQNETISPPKEIPSPEKIEKKDQLKPVEVKLQVKHEQKVNNLRVLSFIVQKYIECPMLIRQRKFDIRVWVLLTHNYEIYFFKQGYLRFSSHKYSDDNHKNPFIHLTNNSVQKHCNQYDQESGNQITLSDLREHLPSEEVYNKIQNKIRQIIWLSMCSVRRKININARKQCFQLFGYDFMIDESHKTWLIQVNTNPAIDECSSVLKMLVPRMLDDMFKLTLDRLYNLKYKEGKEQYPVKGFANQDNMWELLGDFREGVNEKTMGKRLSLIRR